MEWGEAVEGMTEAVVDNRVHVDAVEVRHTSEYLASRVLRTLNAEMKEEKVTANFQTQYYSLFNGIIEINETSYRIHQHFELKRFRICILEVV